MGANFESVILTCQVPSVKPQQMESVNDKEGNDRTCLSPIITTRHIKTHYSETIEGSVSCEIKIQKVKIPSLKEPWLRPLASWVSRQEDGGAGVEIENNKRVDLTCMRDIEAMAVLMSKCENANFEEINFFWNGHHGHGEGDAGELDEDGETQMGAEGWAALGKAMSQGRHQVVSFGVFKSQMFHAKMEDVKKIWDGLSDLPELDAYFWLKISEGEEVFKKKHGDDGWLALEKCLTLTDDEWWFLVASPADTDFYYEDDDELTQKEWLVGMKETLGERIREVAREDE